MRYSPRPEATVTALTENVVREAVFAAAIARFGHEGRHVPVPSLTARSRHADSAAKNFGESSVTNDFGTTPKS